MDLDEALTVAAGDGYLAVVSTSRSDGSIQASVVNAGGLEHPVTGRPVVGFVTYGATKLRNLRSRPQVTLTFRAGWRWATIEGTAELIGPADPSPDVDAGRLRSLLRDVFRAAGGTHDDWEAYDRAMVEQGRAAVLVTPLRIYSN